MDFDWYLLNDSKYRYQIATFSDNILGKRFNKLNHFYMLVTVSANGGVIALTSDKTQILTLREDDPSIKNIVIYSNQGEILNRVELERDPFKNVIVCLEFLQDEFVLALFQKGEQWLVDPFNGEVKKYSLIGLLEEEIIIEGKVFENGYAIKTSMNRFLFVRNAAQPQCIEFVSLQKDMKDSEQMLYWTVFSPKHIISEKVELHMVHPTAGIVQVVENELKRYFFNHQKADHHIESKLPHLKGIKYISGLSPNRKLVTYFAIEPLFKDNPMDQIPQNLKKKKGQNQVQKKVPYAYSYRLIIAPSINSEAIDPSRFNVIELPFVKQKDHLDRNQRPGAIKWCGSKAVVIQFYNQQLYLCSIEGDYVKIEKERGEKDRWSFLREEVDGLRIISKKQNKILRQIPAAYVAIFESFSDQPGALLYSAYEAFEDEAPLQDDQIRKDKQNLAIGVEQCIKSSNFELKFDVVTKLMKAAAYGKTFLPPYMISNNIIYDSAKLLRIVHHLRQQNRYITLQQLKSLTDDLLLKLLLRHREHYLAFQIYKELKKDQNFRVRIFTDWACCKVQNKDQYQDDICDQIQNKLQNEKGVSFTEIAHKAIEVGKSELAMKLLEFQPSLAKKVPLLLWIGNQQNLERCHKFYQKGIDDALKSRDLNLLFLAIRKIIVSEKLSDIQIFQLFSHSPEGVAALINYYRMFSGITLIRYYDYLKNTEAIILEEIRKGFVDRSYEHSQQFYFAAKQHLNNFLSPNQKEWRRDTFTKMYQHFCQFIKYNPQVKSKDSKIKPITIGKQFQVFVAKGNMDAVEDMKKQYKMSDKRAVLTKIKALLDAAKWEDLLAYVQRHQKEHKIPVEMIADILMQKRESVWAMKMMARMPNKHKEEQYLLLQRIGRIKEAIDLAFDRKDVDALEEIQSTLIDATLIGYLNQKMTLLKRK